MENIWFTAFDDEDAEDIWTWVKFCRTLELTDASWGKQMFECGFLIPIRILIIRSPESVGNRIRLSSCWTICICAKAGSFFNIVERISFCEESNSSTLSSSDGLSSDGCGGLTQNSEAYVMTQDKFVFTKAKSEDFFTLNVRS